MTDMQTIKESDFEDAMAPFAMTFDVARLWSPHSIRMIAGLAFAVAVIAWPARSDDILARLIGLAGVVASASMIWGAALGVRRRWIDVGFGVVGIGGGAFLALFPEQSIAVIGWFLAATVLVLAVHGAVDSLRGGSLNRPVAGALSRVSAGLVAAVLIGIYSEALLAAFTIAIAILWIVLGVIALARSLGEHTEGEIWGHGESGRLLLQWLVDRSKVAGDRQLLYDKLFFEHDELRLRLARFVTLMALASVIASMGVLTDSTATVIGAMLIAPLMTPLMATAVSVVMGWPNRLKRSAMVSLGGMLLAIAVGMVVATLVPTTVDVLNNSQIIGRSSPTILDLLTATAAGAAGAYGLSRPDVSDSLPGVAIAIALVPPLTVVGIAYANGEWAAGNGALLLFGTNALAIIIVGGATFVVTGITPLHRVANNQRRVRTATSALTVLAIIVVASLMLNSYNISANALEAGEVKRVADDWIDTSESHDLVQATVVGDMVQVVIVGSSAGRPSAVDLQTMLSEALEREIVADVRLLVEERYTASG